MLKYNIYYIFVIYILNIKICFSWDNSTHDEADEDPRLAVWHADQNHIQLPLPGAAHDLQPVLHAAVQVGGEHTDHHLHAHPGQQLPGVDGPAGGAGGGGGGGGQGGGRRGS